MKYALAILVIVSIGIIAALQIVVGDKINIILPTATFLLFFFNEKTATYFTLPTSFLWGLTMSTPVITLVVHMGALGVIYLLSKTVLSDKAFLPLQLLYITGVLVYSVLALSSQYIMGNLLNNIPPINMDKNLLISSTYNLMWGVGILSMIYMTLKNRLVHRARAFLIENQ